MTNQKLKNQLYLIFPIVFLIISFVWAVKTNYTWDDDATSRYFNTLNAGKYPSMFLDSWSRPLFVVLFYLPIHFFGSWGVIVLMSLLTAFSGILLYHGLRHRGVENAYAVVFLLISQTFLFGITRDSMTEPLACFIVALGCYLYYTERLGWFAFVGSLLPLARSETVLLLPFWAYVLFQSKKYKYIPLLGTGVFLWFLGWTIYAGNLHAFFDEIFKTSTLPVKYERTKITHHFGKYVYVLGPVIFFYFLLGFITNIKKTVSDYFIHLQFIAGFVMYVVFSSTNISLGQSAGPLRNLITLSPFAAIIALYGFNYWMEIFSGKNETVPVKVQPAVTKSNKKQPVKTTEEKDGTSFRKLIIFFLVFFLMLLAVQLLPYKLMYRQFFSEEETDYTVIYFLAGCSFMIILSFLNVFKGRHLLMVIPLFLLQTAFTLYYEEPNSHESPERKAINQTVAWIKEAKLQNHKIYCNHSWYYWAAQTDQTDTTRYGHIDSASLKKINPGDIIIWEAHYTSKNYSNIPLDNFMKDSTMTVIKYITDDEKATRVVILTKQQSNEKMKTLFDNISNNCQEDKTVWYLKGLFEKAKLKDLALSTKSFDKAIALDPEYADAILQRGINYAMQNDKQHACEDLKLANNLGNAEAGKYISQVCK